MRKTLMISAAFAMACSLTPVAYAQPHDASKTVSPSQTPGPGPNTEPFGGPTATAGSSAATNSPPYQQGDDKKPVKCRNSKGKHVKCSAPGSQPAQH
jgi:hypothetical protein